MNRFENLHARCSSLVDIKLLEVLRYFMRRILSPYGGQRPRGARSRLQFMSSTQVLEDAVFQILSFGTLTQLEPNEPVLTTDTCMAGIQLVVIRD